MVLQDLGPDGAASLGELIDRLRARRAAAGAPSYAAIGKRISESRLRRGIPAPAHLVSKTTVYDCFRATRARLDVELLGEIVEALGGTTKEVESWVRRYGEVVDGDLADRRVEVGRQIPVPVAHFVGRANYLTDLDQLPFGGTALLTGMAGVGKSQLAWRAAARLAADHDDVLVLSLGAGDRRRQPATSREALRSLLRAAGSSEESLRGLSVSEMARLWRAWLDERRPLVVLDDAVDDDQLADVVPPEHRGRILVTSRRALGLPGVTLRVEPMSDDEARALIGAVGGRDRPGDREQSTRLAALCGHVPLELAVAAAMLADRPDWSVEDHVRRIELLPRGRQVGAALAATTDDLPVPARTLFRRLALHPGPRVPVVDAAALVDVGVDEAAATLAGLAELNLISCTVGPDGESWVDLHDLVREHAASLLRDEDSTRAQRAAVDQLVGCVTAGVRAHVASVMPRATISGPVPVDRRVEPVTESSEPEALAWLGRRRPMLLDLADLASGLGLHDAVGLLAVNAVPYLKVHGDTWSWQQLSERGLATSDRLVRASLHRQLAFLFVNRGEIVAAEEHLRRTIALVPDVDPIGTLGIRARMRSAEGNFRAAADYFQQAHDAALAEGDELTAARMLCNLGNELRLTGEYDAARRAVHDSLAVSERVGDSIAVIHEISALGLIDEDAGSLDDAATHFNRSLDRAVELGVDYLYDQNHAGLASVRRRQGRYAEALEHAEDAKRYAMGNDSGHLVVQTSVEAGEILLAMGRIDEAAAQFDHGYETARRLGVPIVLRAALTGLGQAALAQDDLVRAERHFLDALELALDADGQVPTARVHAGLARVYRRTGDSVVADHVKLALEVLDRVAPGEAAELRAEMGIVD